VVQERVWEGAEAVDRDGWSDAAGAGLLASAAARPVALDGYPGHFVEQATCRKIDGGRCRWRGDRSRRKIYGVQ
jgi:hypothetical protein